MIIGLIDLSRERKELDMNTMIYDISGLASDIQNVIRTSEKYSKWFSEFPDSLLGVNGDAKTVKGIKYDVLTAILYMAPADLSGYEMCPAAKVAKCKDPCLNTAGRGAMTSVQLSRIRKTLFFMQYRELFLEQLRREMEAHCKYAENLGYLPAIRLNGTTDIIWERILYNEMERLHIKYGARFYDYTKLSSRNVIDPNVYDLTFSYSGVDQFQPHVLRALKKGMRIAVVFRTSEEIPSTFLGRKVINGDDSDIRFNEPADIVSALYAKGNARNDKSGFVVDVADNSSYHNSAAAA